MHKNTNTLVWKSDIYVKTFLTIGEVKQPKPSYGVDDIFEDKT